MPLPERITEVTAGTAIGLGLAGAAAPASFVRYFGFTGKGSEALFFTRLWGTRTAALGALGVTSARGPEGRRFLATVAAMNLADVLLGLRASDLPRRARVLVTLTSAAFAAATGAALTGES